MSKRCPFKTPLLLSMVCDLTLSSRPDVTVPEFCNSALVWIWVLPCALMVPLLWTALVLMLVALS